MFGLAIRFDAASKSASFPPAPASHAALINRWRCCSGESLSKPSLLDLAFGALPLDSTNSRTRSFNWQDGFLDADQDAEAFLS